MFGFLKKACPFCQSPRSFRKALCVDCEKLFAVAAQNRGQVGLGQMLDLLIATGIAKSKIQKFLNSDPSGKGSILDQITAGLTNDLAAGIGVKEQDMTSLDVKRIREKPTSSASTKPIDN